MNQTANYVHRPHLRLCRYRGSDSFFFFFFVVVVVVVVVVVWCVCFLVAGHQRYSGATPSPHTEIRHQALNMVQYQA